MKRNTNECRRGFSLIKILIGLLGIGILLTGSVPVYKKVQQQKQIAILQSFVSEADQEIQHYVQENGVKSEKEKSLLQEIALDLTKFGEVRGKALHANCGCWKAYIVQGTTSTDLFVESNINGISFIRIKYRPYAQIEYNCQYLSAVDNGKKFCEQFAAGDKKWIFNFLDDYAY